jgi:hypothetical protein
MYTHYRYLEPFALAKLLLLVQTTCPQTVPYPRLTNKTKMGANKAKRNSNNDNTALNTACVATLSQLQ